MKRRVLLAVVLFAFHIANAAPFSTNGNRLAYLDSDDPFYVGRDFPKLITPQWVGEDGVDAVVILSIDDLRETPKYEAMLRPILERLKKIDGRAPVSIMVNTLPGTTNNNGGTSSASPQLQSWLKEGLSLEVHTIQHPCPLCQRGDFNAASTNYHECVDLMSSIPGNKPVAFRMPCCDSMNSPSPRFYSEIFNRTSPKGNFLGIDSSVMVILTTNDTSLPRELVMDADGRERFRKYLPTETNATTRVSMGSFATTIEDYPYPYVIGKLCWEFPCIVPSDWEANNLHRPNNPKTVEDWKRALDAIVIKQGVMTLIFRPHGWIQATQMVEFIDYAATKYGKRVKFLNFKEAQERLAGMLEGRTVPVPEISDENRSRTGRLSSNVRLVDVNNDGFLDVLLARGRRLEISTLVWEPEKVRWTRRELPFLLGLFEAPGQFVDVQFGVIGRDTIASTGVRIWRFSDGAWHQDAAMLNGLPAQDFRRANIGLRFRDIDGDGSCELFVSHAGAVPKATVNFAYKWDVETAKWNRLSFALPDRTSIVDDQGRDAGLRFVDVDGDGYDDIIFSNHERYSLHLFRKDSRNLRLNPGWTDEIISGVRGGSARAASGGSANDNASQREASYLDPIPPIVREGTNRNNGVWFKNGTMWIQNEDTAHLPDKVDRRTFKQLLSSGQPRAMSPEESLRAMRVRPGFKVELVASEPLIQTPVAFEWSADGRLWVVEMGDYPNGVDGKGKPGGRVRVLEDTDGDGRYDNATTFLDGLNFPTGIYPWRNGVVISAAPDIFYAEDTDGDGKADVREVLFTGFTEGNQQHRVNGFDYGLDGWLYGANGDSGGNVRAVGGTSYTSPTANRDSRNSSLQGINLRGQDFRIQPDKRLVKAIAGQTQFGRHRDDFGNWFGNNNPTWLWHYFFPEHYLARNPLLPVRTTKKLLANYAESSRCFPISRTLSRFNDAHTANHTTSANSPTPYRDELFGSEFATSVFVSEPVHNLVHREVLEPEGVTFMSRRASDETNSEFLASSDNWFRPAMVKTGPDGALYVADMYRLVIEHPEWIPSEMQKRLDLRAGADKGRIYRVVPEGVTLRKIPNLAKLNSTELVSALDSPNGWQRDTAQRLLIARGDKSVVEKLESLAKGAKSAKVRVQALWTLSGLDALSQAVLISTLKDERAEVREHGVRLSEPALQRAASPHPGPLRRGEGERNAALEQTNTPGSNQRAAQRAPSPGGEGRGEGGLIDVLLALSDDLNSRVRYQLAFTLGEWDDARAADALVKLARDPDDNIRNAVLSSAPRHARAMLAAVENLPNDDRARTMLAMLRKLVTNPPALAAKTSFVERTNTLSAAQRSERAAVLARYADVPQLKGDAKSGAALFQQQCAQCHRLRGEGAEVGPDLAVMAGKPIEQLVAAILDPNAAMEARYKSYAATTKDERELSGIIVAETPTTLTLRAPNKPDETILRAELKELTGAGLSLMPEGLESAFTQQQLADLIAFVVGR